MLQGVVASNPRRRSGVLHPTREATDPADRLFRWPGAANEIVGLDPGEVFVFKNLKSFKRRKRGL
jgi:hypothetical protein